MPEDLAVPVDDVQELRILLNKFSIGDVWPIQPESLGVGGYFDARRSLEFLFRVFGIVQCARRRRGT